MIHDHLASSAFSQRIDYSSSFQSIHRSLNSAFKFTARYFFCRPARISVAAPGRVPARRRAVRPRCGPVGAHPLAAARFSSARVHQDSTTRRARTARLLRPARHVHSAASCALFPPRHFPQERKLTAKLASHLVRVPLVFFSRYSISDMLNYPFSPSASAIAQNAQVRH